MLMQIDEQILKDEKKRADPKAVVSQEGSREGSRKGSPVLAALMPHLVADGARSPICSNNFLVSAEVAPEAPPFRSP